MATYENIKCGDEAENTGSPSCAPEFGPTEMLILAPKGFRIPQASRATPALLLAFLQGAAAETNKANRIYPVQQIVAMEPTGSDAVTQEFGYGPTVTVRRGKIAWTYTYAEGICLNSALIKGFDRKPKSYELFRVDGAGNLDGTLLANGDAKGYSLEDLYISPLSEPDGSTTTTFTIRVALSKQVEYEQNRVISGTDTGTGSAITDLSGLQSIRPINVTPGVLPAPAAGTYYIDVVTSCGTQSLIDQYETELELPANWSASNNTNGTNIPITSITATTLTNGNRALTFVLDTTAAGWVVGNGVLLCLDDYATLIAAGIEGYEPAPRCVVLPNA